jgi:hypothetical protein
MHSVAVLLLNYRSTGHERFLTTCGSQKIVFSFSNQCLKRVQTQAPGVGACCMSTTRHALSR